MILDSNVDPYLVQASAPLRDALRAIDANRSRIVFAVDSEGTLVGALSDGDFRRWLLTRESSNLNAPVSRAMNPIPRAGRINDADHIIERLLTTPIGVVPLLDDDRRVVANPRVPGLGP